MYYPEKKEEVHETRFDEVRNHKDCTMKYGPSFKKSNHPLEIMVSEFFVRYTVSLLTLTVLAPYMQVQHGRLEMLTHPLISSLLQHKWFHFGLRFYLLKMLIYIIFLVFLTAFAVFVLPPHSNTCTYNPVAHFQFTWLSHIPYNSYCSRAGGNFRVLICKNLTCQNYAYIQIELHLFTTKI